MFGFDLIEIIVVLLYLSLIVFITLIPLIVWGFYGNGKKPGWQLIFIFIFTVILAPLGFFIAIIYSLNIIISHKGLEKSK